MEPNTPEQQPFIQEDDFQELMALVRALRLANGVTFLFAQCENSNYRDTLIKQTQRLYGDWIIELRIPRETDRLIDYLVKAVPNYATAIYLVGLEDWLMAGPIGETSRFISTLNSSRNHFAQLIHCPIVFWAPPYIFTMLLRGAPDFFSTVTAIYTFSHGNEQRIPHLKNTFSSRGTTQQESELLALLIEHDNLPTNQQEETTRAILLIGIGKTRLESGQYSEAESPLKEALEIMERKFGLQHQETATAINELGVLYLFENRLEEAEKLFQEAFRIRETIFGPEHPSLATSINNIAALYETQGRYGDAEALYQRALKTYIQSLGTNHPITATSINNLGGVYYVQGKYEDAEPLLLLALSISEQTLGPDHPDTATSLNNLANLYHTQGKNADAEALYRRALEIWQRSLGENHQYTHEVVRNLNELYRLQHRSEEMLPEQ